MKIFTRTALWLVMALTAAFSAKAIGWPANYEGVMLQGFYWDSYTDTNWANLEKNADEYSKYFKLIWVPNSGRCGGANNMGYMPQYWFSNHNSSFGTEAQLRSMIKTYKAKGTGFIADVVINHRNGVTNWHDFPTETWNGQTWKIGLEGICSNDEMAYADGQPKPTGAPDTGENFEGCRDLDHTNANVQNNCKNYCKYLLTDLGYTGFRYDMVKGYSGYYNKIYNQYSGVKYSVGEYWDGNYDAVKNWIEATGRESAAFDFPCKYAINEAFHSNDMTKLVWKANGTTDQPAGMIHFGYAQLAVTFVDNHDTYRDGSKFNGNVVAANAFILFSPGTPCIFLPHYKAHKAEIQRLIDIRNSCGIHNCSEVTVLKSTGNCYMAQIKGSKGTAVVKIGSAMESPAGYSSSDIKASGNDYCVWTKTQVEGGNQGGGNQGGGETTTGNWVYFDNTNSNWTTPHIHYWGAAESTWPGVAMAKESGNIWKYEVPEGTTGLLFNAGDGDATKTGDFVFVANHLYTTAGDQGLYNGGNQGGGNQGGGSVSAPSQLYIMGNLALGSWKTNVGVAMTKDGDVFVANNVELEALEAGGLAYFSFVTALGTTGDDTEWDGVINGSDRFGATTKDAQLTVGTAAPMKLFAVGVDASSAYAWCVPSGKYTITADFANMTVKVDNNTSLITSVEYADEDVAPVYYNLQGVRVENPTSGLYIVVRGTKVTKELVR